MCSEPFCTMVTPFEAFVIWFVVVLILAFVIWRIP